MRFHSCKTARLNTINLSIKYLKNWEKFKSLAFILKSEFCLFKNPSCFLKSFYKMKISIGWKNTLDVFCGKTSYYCICKYERANAKTILAFLEISQSISKYRIFWILRYRFDKFEHFWNCHLLQLCQKKLTSH